MQANPPTILMITAVQVALLIFCAHALAEPTGKELDARCQRAETMESGGSVSALDALNASQCMSFVTGVTSGLHVAKLLVESGRSYCPPETLSPAQAITIIRQYFFRYPELLHEDAGLLAADALITEFPCAQELATQQQSASEKNKQKSLPAPP